MITIKTLRGLLLLATLLSAQISPLRASSPVYNLGQSQVVRNPSQSSGLFLPLPSDTTIAFGDSIEFAPVIPCDINGNTLWVDSLMKWKVYRLGTTDSVSGVLRTNKGFTTTFYSAKGNPYTAYQVVATYYDPIMPERVYKFTATIFIKRPPIVKKLWIEPDTNINIHSTSAADLYRLRYPNHVPAVTLGMYDSTTVIAIERDIYGNFVDFCRTAHWQIIGDTGIASVTWLKEKPYLCRIKAIYSGNVFVRLWDDYGSITDSIPVNVRCGCMDYMVPKLRVVDVNTGLQVDSIKMNTNQDITLKLQGRLRSDTTKWIDVSALWTTSTAFASEIPLPVGEAGSYRFSPLEEGLTILTATLYYGRNSVSIPILTKACISDKTINAFRQKMAQNISITHQYYNLRGQRLSHDNMRRVHGLIFERTVNSNQSPVTKKQAWIR